MYVKTKMTTNPYTVSSDMSVAEAYEVIRQHRFRRLPVVDNGKLVGIVTEKDLQKLSPSQATTLSVHEVNYLLSKTKVRNAMCSKLVTTSPDSLLEEAAVLMRDHNVGALPVVDAQGKLVGIITETDIFDSFTELMGLREHGTRITVTAPDSPGVLSDITKIIGNFGVNIIRIAVYHSEGSTSDVVIRINSTNTQEIEKELEAHGYKIIHILKNE